MSKGDNHSPSLPPTDAPGCAVVEIAAPDKHDSGPLRREQRSDRWFVLKTRSRQEKAVARTLNAAGIQCYLPMLERVRFCGHRRRVVSEPLFSTYLFLSGSLEATYFALATRRVARVIPVPDQVRLVHELSQIQCVIARKGELDPYGYLVRGRPVRVTGGPFRGVEGLVEDRTKPSRLVLQVEVLGRAMGLEIDVSLLEAVE